MGNFKKVTARTPRAQSPANSARWLNSVSDVAAWYQRQIAGGQAQQPGRGLKPPPIKVRNKTGADRLRGHAVQLGDYLITKGLKENQRVDFRKLWFEGELPSDPIRKVAILRKAIKADKIGEAQMSGVCTAWVNITDVEHTHAVPEADNHVLQSGTSGSIEILQTLTETGEQEVAVLLGGGGSTINTVWGQAVGAMSGTGNHSIDNIQLMDGVDPRDDPESTSETLELQNPFGYTSDDNGIVEGKQYNGVWYVRDSKCPA